MEFWDKVLNPARGKPGRSAERVTLAEWQEADQLGPAWDYMPSPAPDKIILGWGLRKDGAGLREILVGCHDNRHVLTVGGTRAGKGVSLLIPNLLYYGTGPAGGKGQGGSVLAIDPKGELARLTLEVRTKDIGQRCFVLDPFNASGYGGAASDGFNPLAEMDKFSDDTVEKAAVVADAMVQPAERDPHWGEAARMFVRALILYVVMTGPEGADLGAVRKYLMLSHPKIAETRRRWAGDPDAEPPVEDDRALLEALRLRLTRATGDAEFDGRLVARLGKRLAGEAMAQGGRKRWEDSDEMMLFEMMKHAAHMKAVPFRDIVAGMGATFASMSERERASVLSSARTQTEFLDSDPLQNVLAKHSFRISDLKEGIAEEGGTRRNITVYLCLEAKHLGYYNRWLRVIVGLALSGLEGEKNKPDIPTLLVLDEFGTTLQRMAPIETAAGLIAGSGVRLWTVLQDLTQLKRHYAQSWETFVGNAGVAMFFGNSDLTTLKYISERLGRRGVLARTRRDVTRVQDSGGDSGASESLQSQPLWATHEIEQGLRREEGAELVMMAGEKPVLLRRVVYYEEEPFKSRIGKYQGAASVGAADAPAGATDEPADKSSPPSAAVGRPKSSWWRS